MIEVVITHEEEGVRLDSFLANKLSAEETVLNNSISRSQAQKILRSGLVSSKGKILKPSSKLNSGQTILIDLPEEFTEQPPEKGDSNMQIEPEKIGLEVLYEDEAILVINKPKGMAVHGAPDTETRTTGTLVNALLYHCMDKEGQVHLSSKVDDQYFRPGIVHRLDRQTSGVLVIAKSSEAHLGLREQFEKHTITRKYKCLCHGAPIKSNGRINSLIGRHPTVRTRQTILQDLSDVPEENLELIAESSGKGKLARSAWNRLHTFTLPFEGDHMIPLNHQVALMEFELFTGRTHQIRAQMQRLGNPLLFDPLYRTSSRKRTQLHLPTVSTFQEQFLAQRIDWSNLQLFTDNETPVTDDPIRNMGQLLHASSLSLVHPTQNIPLTFEAPFPKYFRHVVRILRSLK